MCLLWSKILQRRLFAKGTKARGTGDKTGQFNDFVFYFN